MECIFGIPQKFAKGSCSSSSVGRMPMPNKNLPLKNHNTAVSVTSTSTNVRIPNSIVLTDSPMKQVCVGV